MNREYDVATVELEGKFNYHIIQKRVCTCDRLLH